MVKIKTCWSVESIPDCSRSIAQCGMYKLAAPLDIVELCKVVQKVEEIGAVVFVDITASEHNCWLLVVLDGIFKRRADRHGVMLFRGAARKQTVLKIYGRRVVARAVVMLCCDDDGWLHAASKSADRSTPAYFGVKSGDLCSPGDGSFGPLLPRGLPPQHLQMLIL